MTNCKACNFLIEDWEVRYRCRNCGDTICYYCRNHHQGYCSTICKEEEPDLLTDILYDDIK